MRSYYQPEDSRKKQHFASAYNPSRGNGEDRSLLDDLMEPNSAEQAQISRSQFLYGGQIHPMAHGYDYLYAYQPHMFQNHQAYSQMFANANGNTQAQNQITGVPFQMNEQGMNSAMTNIPQIPGSMSQSQAARGLYGMQSYGGMGMSATPGVSSFGMTPSGLPMTLSPMGINPNQKMAPIPPKPEKIVEEPKKEEKSIVYARNVSKRINTVDKISHALGKFGTITNCKVLPSEHSAIIQFENEKMAQEAVEKGQNSAIFINTTVVLTLDKNYKPPFVPHKKQDQFGDKTKSETGSHPNPSGTQKTGADAPKQGGPYQKEEGKPEQSSSLNENEQKKPKEEDPEKELKKKLSFKIQLLLGLKNKLKGIQGSTEKINAILNKTKAIQSQTKEIAKNKESTEKILKENLNLTIKLVIPSKEAIPGVKASLEVNTREPSLISWFPFEDCALWIFWKG